MRVDTESISLLSVFATSVIGSILILHVSVLFSIATCFAMLDISFKAIFD